MNPEIKAAWVAALRSGDYKKGNYQLRDLHDRWDATGVLCDLAIKAGVDVPVTKHDDPDGLWFGYQYGDKRVDHNRANGLPKAVQEWADITYRKAYSLAMRGDERKDFTKLADWIEENL